jgi:hypothetical protein
MTHILLAAIAAACVLVQSEVRAEQTDESTRAAARLLAAEGDALLSKGDHAGALDRFHRASALAPVPTVLLREALCLEKLGKWVEAWMVYHQAARSQPEPGDPPSFREAATRAKSSADALQPRLPRLIIMVTGDDIAGAKAEVDGREVPSAAWGAGWPVNPGVRHVIAYKDARAAAADVDAKEASASTVTLEIPPADPSLAPPAPTAAAAPATAAPTALPAAKKPAARPWGIDASVGMTVDPSMQRTWGWIGVIVGGAGVVTGAIGAGVARARMSDMEDDGKCHDYRCASSASQDIDRYNAARSASIAGFVIGGVGLGVGAFLLWTAPKPAAQPKAAWSPWLGPGAAGLAGTF